MNDQVNDAATNSYRFALHDGRALLGAVALNITGWILAFMLYQYLETPAGSTGLSRSRLVWEVILNLQILSIAFVWFCYSDRIEGSDGKIHNLQVARLWFAMITILQPSFLGLLGIQQNWFMEPPSQTAILLFAGLVLAFWLFGVWLNWLVSRMRKTRLPPGSLRYRLVFFIPASLLAVLIAVDAPTGGQLWLLGIPALTYLQGSMPYIVKAFGVR